MTTPPEPRTTVRPLPPPRRRRAGLAAGLAVVTVLLLIGVIGLFGGWEPASQRELPSVEPLEPVHVEPFDLALMKAFQADSAKPALRHQDNMRWLIVTLEAKNTVSFPISPRLLTESVLLTAPEVTSPGKSLEHGIPATQALRYPDGLRLASPPPDLPQKVILAWQQSTAEPPPETVTITLVRHSYEDSFLYDSFRWFDPEAVATATLKVEELKEQ